LWLPCFWLSIANGRCGNPWHGPKKAKGEIKMNLPNPASPEAPKYWMYETGGRLAHAIMRLIDGKSLSADDILYIRAYLRQWIDSPAWDLNPAADNESRLELATLRTTARQIKSRQEINEWIAIATKLGMDPL
jgi:hypothetical protein